MTQFLPPNLLALFAAREPIPYLPPTDTLSHDKKRRNYTGLGDFVHSFEKNVVRAPTIKIESREERGERKRKEKAELAAYRLEQDLALWDPKQNAKATEDPYTTLFVARIAYDTSESKLRREFGSYGRIRSVRMIHNIETGAPRGYAFIEYEKEADMHAAYKYADGKKIDGRRVVVDVERGRTVKGWRPRRLAGGLGGSRRIGKGEANLENEERSAPPSSSSVKYSSSRHKGSEIDERRQYEPSSRRQRGDSREVRRDHRDYGSSRNRPSHNDSRRRSPDRYSRQKYKSPQRNRNDRSRSGDRRRHRRREMSKSASRSSDRLKTRADRNSSVKDGKHSVDSESISRTQNHVSDSFPPPDNYMHTPLSNLPPDTANNVPPHPTANAYPHGLYRSD